MDMARLSRRQFLAKTGVVLAGVAATGACRSLEGPVGRKEAAEGFKLGVCDWTIGKRTDPASLAIAKRIGVDGVQVDFGSGEEQLPLFDKDLQKRFLEESERQQVEIASLALGALNWVPYKSDPRAERWLLQSIDVCRAMGVRVVLVAFFARGDLRGDKQGIDTVVERLRKAAPKAEAAGVYLGLESWLSADEHLDIIERVGSPAVKVYYDVGNAQSRGYDVCAEIRQLGQHICEFHAKDYDDLYGKGSMDFPAVRRAIDDIGYRGWIVMEGVKMPLGVEESCRYDAQYLRQIFPRKL